MLKKNFLLFTWKNIHEWPRLSSSFLFHVGRRDAELAFGDSPERPNFAGIARAALQLPRSDRVARTGSALAAVSDTEAFRSPLGGHFRDTLRSMRGGFACQGFENPEAGRIGVLFVSPYPICPPVHGGGVFMYQTIRQLARLCDLHLIVAAGLSAAARAHRRAGSNLRIGRVRRAPRRAQKAWARSNLMQCANFEIADLAWLIHRQIYLAASTSCSSNTW